MEKRKLNRITAGFIVLVVMVLAADGHDIVAHETRLLIVWLQVRARLFIRTSCFFIL